MFGPKLYDGVGFRHMFDENYLEHIEVILQQCNLETTTGEILSFCYQAAKLAFLARVHG